MGRPLKRLSDDKIINTMVRLRSRNNRDWGRLWKVAIKTKKGRAMFRKIMATDLEVYKWGSRI